MRRHVGWMALALAVAFPCAAWAAGYGIYEAGAGVMGMAGAGTAAVNDASALFYNPAALNRIVGAGDDHRGLWYVGGSMLSISSSFAGVNPYPGYGVTEEMKPTFFPIPAVYYARGFGERMAAGIGVYTPYGLGIHWNDPSSFTGRYIVTEAKLASANLGLSGAFRIHPRVSVSAGANVLFAQVRLDNRLLQPIPGGGGEQVDVARLELRSHWKPGYGWNAAIDATPANGWRLGATYRSKVIVKPSGDAEFSQIPTGVAPFDSAVAAGLPPDQGVSTVLRFPAIWAAGAAWSPGRWTLATSVVFTEWTLFTDLPIEFDQTPSNNRDLIEDYDDTFAIRAGAEHRLDRFTYRFGYYFEQEAAPAASVSPILPDARRHGVTLGLGFKWGAANIDLYNLFLFAEQRGTEGVNRDGFDGEYKTYVNAAGANAAFHW
jgi:long-chain fatty acid transport protein